MNQYRITFEACLDEAGRRTAIVEARSMVDAAHMLLAAHEAICVFKIEDLGVRHALSTAARPQPWHAAQQAFVSSIATLCEALTLVEFA